MYYIRLVEADMDPREGGLEDFVLPQVPAVGDKITVVYGSDDEVVYEVMSRTFHIEFGVNTRQLKGCEGTDADVSIIVRKAGSTDDAANGKTPD